MSATVLCTVAPEMRRRPGTSLCCCHAPQCRVEQVWWLSHRLWVMSMPIRIITLLLKINKN